MVGIDISAQDGSRSPDDEEEENGTAASERVGEWMTMYPDAFLPDMDVGEAADWMLAAGYRHLPVMDEGRLIGMVSIKDILWALSGDAVG